MKLGRSYAQNAGLSGYREGIFRRSRASTWAFRCLVKHEVHQVIARGKGIFADGKLPFFRSRNCLPMTRTTGAFRAKIGRPKRAKDSPRLCAQDSQDCGMRARSPVAARLGKRVAELRLQNGMGQKELAPKASTTAKVISQLERGISVPAIEKLEKIATAVCAELADLFGYSEDINDRRRQALVQIDYMLRGRSTADLEAVRDMLRLVFEIKRRERSESTPKHRKNRARSKGQEERDQNAN